MNMEIKPSLLLVDDDPLILETLAPLLAPEYVVIQASRREEALGRLVQADGLVRIALIDLGLPPNKENAQEGLRLIPALLKHNPAMRIIALSSQNDQYDIREALRLGAVDVVSKPCDIDVLLARLQHQQVILDAEQQFSSGQHSNALIGDSPSMAVLRQEISQLADVPFPVLIEGESGTGKELVAKFLHEQSSRADSPLLIINCASFNAELLESQLFGYAKGAFTGAISNKAGFFEEANDGTLILDEIGELPLELQAKLLRVLENGEFYRIGEARPRYAKCRIIAATNRNLRQALGNGSFRDDLYHRLGVLNIYVPPLRERGDDRGILFEHFMRAYASGAEQTSLSPAAWVLWRQYSFPGNVRELRNIVIRLNAKYPGRQVNEEQLSRELHERTGGRAAGVEQAGEQPGQETALLLEGGFSLDKVLAEYEKKYIDLAIELSQGNMSKAANILGINRTTLYGKLGRLEKLH